MEIRYTTASGAHVIERVTADQVERRLKALHRRHVEAYVYDERNEEVGFVGENYNGERVWYWFQPSAGQQPDATAAE